MKGNKKIAIMMTVHKNEEQVKRLIKHLSKDFDIYVHIDQKSSLKISKTENVFVYKKYQVYWGSFNQIITTLYLLQRAFKKGYNRYILISGQDMPIKTNDEIKLFFKNNDAEYIHIEKIPNQRGWPNMDRLTKYHFNQMNSRIDDKKYIRKITRGFSKFMSIIRPRKLNCDFYGGANWTNYTHNCVEKIFEYLENNPEYINRFKWTSCADEIFYQTIVNQLNGLKIINNCLRYVNWIDGPEHPKTLRTIDYKKIMNNNKNLFARKFDENVDKEIIEMIYKKIENR